MDIENWKEKQSVTERSTPGCYIKTRHVLAVMMFLGVFNSYFMRINLNVAIVAMVSQSVHTSITNATECPDRGASYILNNTMSNGVFEWDRTQQGIALGAYYYGYILTCLLGGYLTNRFGVKPVIGISMLLSSIISLLSPALAYRDFTVFVIARVLLGFLQGVTLPAVQSAWGRWAPPLERSRLVAISFSGISFGVFITSLVTGGIAENYGWEAIFYISGTVTLLWTMVWFGTVHSWPQSHPRISIHEKAYIIESIGLNSNHEEAPQIPWTAILKSVPVWAITVAHFCGLWGACTFLAMLPTFMATILRFSLTASGAWTAVPYVLQFLLVLVAGHISDELRMRGVLSTIAVRKLNTSLALAVPATLVGLVGYVDCNVHAAVAIFSLAVAFNSLTVPGCESNAIDLAPQFGGVLYGIANTIGNISGFLAPQMAGMLLQHDESMQGWRMVFWTTAAVYMFGAIFYLIFASGEEQTWGKQTNTIESKYTAVEIKKGTQGK